MPGEVYERRKEAAIERIMKLQETVVELSQRRQEVRDETNMLSQENDRLKEYLDNLIAHRRAASSNA